MADKKITKRDRFNTIIEWAEEKGDNDMVAFAEHEIELLDKKKSGTKSETKAQKINKVLDERIMDVLNNAEEPMTASTIMGLVDIDGIEGLESLNLPKVTNRLTALGKVGGRVDRIKDKRAVLFSAGTGEGFNKE